ncbi:MAG: hypothetical protein DCC75_00815 [Proteobacteria bacterium]|nr:MAG: hypothetical protein DCC75_00815 [Pseudomonadota bacterium]
MLVAAIEVHLVNIGQHAHKTSSPAIAPAELHLGHSYSDLFWKLLSLRRFKASKIALAQTISKLEVQYSPSSLRNRLGHAA